MSAPRERADWTPARLAIALDYAISTAEAGRILGRHASTIALLRRQLRGTRLGVDLTVTPAIPAIARTLVTTDEAAPVIGYSPESLSTSIRKRPHLWPQPVAHTRTRRVPQYDLDALVAALEARKSADPPPAPAPTPPPLALEAGRYAPPGTQPRTWDTIQCLECGQWYGSLAAHTSLAHQINAATYRERHGLRRRESMWTDAMRETAREQGLARAASDPSVGSALRALTPEQRTTVARESNVQRRIDRETHPDMPDPALEKLAQAATRGRAVRQKKAAARRQALAETAGYQSWEAMLRETIDESAASIGARLGLSEMTISEARRKILGSRWRDLRT